MLRRESSRRKATYDTECRTLTRSHSALFCLTLCVPHGHILPSTERHARSREDGMQTLLDSADRYDASLLGFDHAEDGGFVLSRDTTPAVPGARPAGEWLELTIDGTTVMLTGSQWDLAVKAIAGARGLVVTKAAA